MDDLYKPISRQEMLHALVQKFGAVETARYFLNDAIADLQSMEVGISENNPMLSAKSCESLKENLTNIRTLLEKKENKSSIEKEIKQNIM